MSQTEQRGLAKSMQSRGGELTKRTPVSNGMRSW